MKPSSTILAIAIAIALVDSAAIAQDATQDSTGSPVLTRTRAEVAAELAWARASGELQNRGEAYGSFDFRRTISTRTRAEVRAELAQARATGQVEDRGEAYGSFDVAQLVSTRSRAEVLVELEQARADGLLDNRGEAYGAFDHVQVTAHRTRNADARAEYRRAMSPSQSKSAPTAASAQGSGG